MLGGIAAGVLFVWPGFVTLTALAWAYQTYGHVAGLAGFLDGVRPVAMALVAAAAVRISRKALKGRLSYLLMGAAFLASYAVGVPFVVILVGCGALGFMLGGRHRESRTANPRLHGWLFVLLVAGLVAAARLSPSSPFAPSADRSRGAGLLAPRRPARDLARAARRRRVGEHDGRARQPSAVRTRCFRTSASRRWTGTAGWTIARSSTAWRSGRRRQGR